MLRKEDADEISAVVDELAGQQWLGRERSHWPQYVFHVTAVENAVSIMASGVLMSRNRAQSLGLMKRENASREIIEQTLEWVYDYVRLYFRPRTPTFFCNEGIRPIGQRDLDAHCPVPVALLLDSRAVLGLKGCRFSDGNLARKGRIRLEESATSFRQLPFEHIYHNHSLYGLSDDERDRIVFHRNAEVIYPEELPVAGLLRHVFVRSPAERDTLIALLRSSGVHASDETLSMIRINTKNPLFFKRWTYVERVFLDDGMLGLVFNPSTHTPGSFSARFQVEDARGTILSDGWIREFYAATPYWYGLPSHLDQPFRFRLLLDGDLAYENDFDPTLRDSLVPVPF